jgi:hypothetical protein
MKNDSAEPYSFMSEVPNPTDSENFAFPLLITMTLGSCFQHRSKAFVIHSWRPAAIPISNEILNSFGAVYFTLYTAACHYSMSTTNTERTLKCCSIIFTLRRCQAQPLLLIMKSPPFINLIVIVICSKRTGRL